MANTLDKIEITSEFKHFQIREITDFKAEQEAKLAE